MTKIELELICAIIDRHTETYETGHCGPTSKRINEVDKLKIMIFVIRFQELIRKNLQRTQDLSLHL